MEAAMSLLDFFKSKKLPPGDVITQKAGYKLINKNSEIEGRYGAADTLAQIGTEEAVYCLLQRFTVVIGTDIPDGDEKRYVYEKIVQLKHCAIAPILRFLKEKEQAAQALQLLKELTPPEEFLNHLIELIGGFDPYFSKYPDKKIQAINALSDFYDERIVALLEPFLDDDDDVVRTSVIRTLSKQQNEEPVRELLLKAIVDSGERPRVRIAACEVVSELKWRVTGYRKQVENVLPERFYMDGKGHILIKPDYKPTISDSDLA
jgi:HEAT repeat protein